MNNVYICPHCGGNAVDLECPECYGEAGNDTCELCHGEGVIDGEYECLECGYVYDETEVRDDD